MSAKKRGRPLIWIGVILMVLGVVVAALGLSGVQRLRRRRHPDESVCERTRRFRIPRAGQVHGLRTVGDGQGTSTDGAVHGRGGVRDWADGAVAVSAPGLTETVTRVWRLPRRWPSSGYPTAGAYRINISTDVATQVIVGRSLGSSFGAAIGWIRRARLGALAALTGLVLLIVGVIRGSRRRVPRGASVGIRWRASATTNPRTRRTRGTPVPPVRHRRRPPSRVGAPSVSGHPAPGWYPDPDQAGVGATGTAVPGPITAPDRGRGSSR